MNNVRLCFSVGGPARYWTVGDPRKLWPREGDFCRWLAASSSQLAECIEMPGLEVTGWEVVAGERVVGFDHLGKLVTYAHAVQASVAVWAIAAAEPPFLREHLDALAELNEMFAGRRRFTAVTVTLESEPSPVPLAPGTPLLPRMSRIV